MKIKTMNNATYLENDNVSRLREYSLNIPIFSLIKDKSGNVNKSRVYDIYGASIYHMYKPTGEEV